MISEMSHRQHLNVTFSMMVMLTDRCTTLNSWHGCYKGIQMSDPGLDLQPDGLTAGLAGHYQPDKKISTVSKK